MKRQNDIDLSTEGFIKAVTSSRKPEAVDVLGRSGLTIVNINLITQEQNIINPIIKIFKSENMETQLCVLEHWIDLDFHDWNLAIECFEKILPDFIQNLLLS